MKTKMTIKWSENSRKIAKMWRFWLGMFLTLWGGATALHIPAIGIPLTIVGGALVMRQAFRDRKERLAKKVG